MKAFLSFLPNAVTISFLAACVQIFDQMAVGWGGIGPLIAGGGWISFQAWAVYFLAGSVPIGAARAIIGYTIGIVASVCIFTMGGWLGGLAFWAMPITLLILVIPIIYLMKAPELFNLVPSVFIGAGMFFGLMSYLPSVDGAFAAGSSVWSMYAMAGLGELTYAAIGLLCGFLTIFIWGLFPGAKDEAEAAAE